MIPEERREKILKNLYDKDIYTIDDLTKEFRVSRITIQRDIGILVERGMVNKIHGGVKLRKDYNKKIENRFSLRMKQNLEKKTEIAKKALEFVTEASIIFLDASTTIFIFMRELFKKNFIDLNIITNSPAIICSALEYPEVKVVSTGGEINTELNMLAGTWVIDFLQNININSAFISAAGITPAGKLTSNNREIANVLSTVFSRTEEVNLLVDSSKLYKQGMIEFSSLSECRRIITDKDIDMKVLSEIETIDSLEIVY